MLGIAAQQPYADQVVGIDIAAAQELSIMGVDAHSLARCQGRQRHPLGIDFVAVDPGMAGANASIRIPIEPDVREIHGMRRAG